MAKYDILSLFPEYFRGPFDESMIKRARAAGLLDINLVDIRDFADNRHHRVDDRPYGGGPGMVLMPEPVVKAIRSVKTMGSKVIYMSPQGRPLNAKKCRELSRHDHYEGIDERAIEKEVDEEISIGDYVLTNGCAAAIVLIDAVSRFIPGVIGHEEAVAKDSFESGRLDCPHYTRPEMFEGLAVPEVLLSGHHQKIEEWRRIKSDEKTRLTRPDLI
jgi:tRNA (guanine37-N1)-methyltransferase